ncbi:MAG: REP-associated tyrosine transposase [Ktedonobacteraceae bacterium]
MPAFARVAIPGIAYHVTQRGNYRQDIFATDEDHGTYLGYVASAALAYRLELHGWCLMTNHVHWIVLPEHEMAMVQAFRRAHSRFADYVKRKHKRAAGHLWQVRYYSCALDEEHYFAALRYVERNPLRAGLVRSPAVYRWSSAAARLGLAPAPLSRKKSYGNPEMHIDFTRGPTGNQPAI